MKEGFSSTIVCDTFCLGSRKTAVFQVQQCTVGAGQVQGGQRLCSQDCQQKEKYSELYSE